MVQARPREITDFHGFPSCVTVPAMSACFGTLGKEFEAWKPSSSCPCLDHARCGVLHDHRVDIMVWGECPTHDTSQVNVNQCRLGNKGFKGDDLVEPEMMCGDYAVGIKQIWVNMKVAGLLCFSLGVRCCNPRCRSERYCVTLINRVGKLCKQVNSIPCCKQPKLDLTEFRARLLNVGDETKVRIHEIEFPEFSDDIEEAGILEVVACEDRFVAVPGPQASFFKYAKDNFGRREVRVERLLDPANSHLMVRIIRC